MAGSRIAVLGATGFVGRALVLKLIGAGHRVTALVRSPTRARDMLAAEVAIADFTDDAALARAVAEADAVVNLAGEPIAGQRWTRKRKRALRTSRIDVTRRLTDAIARRSSPLPTLVSASAIGWYGDRGDAILDERDPPGEGFAADLCRDWEAEASTANATRIVCARLGVVLGLEGGALAALMRIFRLGLGGPIAGGRQWLSWIHLEDAVNALHHMIEDDRLFGAVAVVSPAPVRQRELASSLGHALGRRAMLPVPRSAIGLVLGEAAAMVTDSQRVRPRALEAVGFEYRFPELEPALADLLDDGVEIHPTDRAALPAAPYLETRRPRYTLTTRTTIDAPIARVFEFFSSAGNLAAITPPGLGFEIVTPGPIAMTTGARIDYRIRVGKLRMTWRTEIERWQPGASFVDAQVRGPYRAWWHEHRFSEQGGRTIMEDVVHYAPPFGLLGRIANRVAVAGMLRRIFGYRRQAIRARFGTTHARPSELMSRPAADA